MLRRRGDEAVREYTLRFDGHCPDCFEVSREEINDALTEADSAFVDALLNAQQNIADFTPGKSSRPLSPPRKTALILGQRIRRPAQGGHLCPRRHGGLPSTVLMNAVPAKIAGVGELVW